MLCSNKYDSSVMLSKNVKFNEVKVIFRNQEQTSSSMLSQLQNQVPLSQSLNRPGRVQTLKKKKKKKLGMDTRREGRTSSHGLWFRTVLNALCLGSDVSRGHGHLHLLALCPSSEIASLSIETGTCGGSSSDAHRALSSVHVRWASDA